MADSNDPSGMKISAKSVMLPPKSPFPNVDYVPNHVSSAQTSGEATLPEEQPSWLDDLLNEPDSPLCRGHRRSSSDSMKHVGDTSFTTFREYQYKNLLGSPSWGYQDFNYRRNPQESPPFIEADFNRFQSRGWGMSMNAMAHPSGILFTKENAGSYATTSNVSFVVPRIPFTSERHRSNESTSHDSRGPTEKRDFSRPRSSASENDSRRAKQQLAQRSRVRKLQYIAELERNVQMLQTDRSEVGAELEFLNRQNLLLSMENIALRQRLDNVAQEQLIKYVEQEMLEKEVGRLRSVYQYQQLQPSECHKALDARFSNMSIKSKDSNSALDPVSSSLHI